MLATKGREKRRQRQIKNRNRDKNRARNRRDKKTEPEAEQDAQKSHRRVVDERRERMRIRQQQVWMMTWISPSTIQVRNSASWVNLISQVNGITSPW